MLGLNDMMFEVLTIMSTMIVVFWDLMVCSLVDRYQYFGGTNNLHQTKEVICSTLIHSIYTFQGHREFWTLWLLP